VPTTTSKVYDGIPPVRAEPTEDDRDDARRVTYVANQWDSLTPLYRLRDRSIEECVRMLCGQHWLVWDDFRNRFTDLTQVFTDRQWRERPVINVLLEFYILTHARLTETEPIIAFQPATGDFADAQLAQVQDILFKTIWRNAEMVDVLDRAVAWMIPGGRVHMKSRIDTGRGAWKPWVGPAVMSMDLPDGGSVQRYIQHAAYDNAGNALGRLVPVEGAEDEYGYELGEEQAPHAERTGEIVVDVLSPLEVRGSAGPTPWHQKRRHLHRCLLPPETVFELWGVEVEPDIRGQAGKDAGEIQRLLHGAGFYGATSQRGDALFAAQDSSEYVTVTEMWERPSRFPGTEEAPDQPGGRLLVTLNNKVGYDGPRPAAFRYTSPIRTLDFLNIPGRPSGSTVQEALNPLVRANNRLVGQQLQHAAICANPIALIRDDSGITEANWTNRPGAGLVHHSEGGQDPVKYLAAPSLGADVYRAGQSLAAVFDRLANIPGSTGAPPSQDPSGELVKELRFNSDRYLGPVGRRAAMELGRLAEDWMVLAPLIWDQETTITYAGEDQILRTLTVYPHLFEQGNCNVVPNLESMVPEGRGEKQSRLAWMYQQGLFGPPGTPQAVKQYLELARFPHLDRTALPGGINRVMAEQNMGKLARGEAAADIAVFPWYDHGVHIGALTEFMSSPDFVGLNPRTQMQFVLLLERLREARMEAAASQMQEQMVMATQQAAMTGQVAQVAAASGPPADPAEARPPSAPHPQAA
jgi:hypothetical protein